MKRQTYLVKLRKTGKCIPMSEYIRKLGLSYDTVLARINRANKRKVKLPWILFLDNDPIFDKVQKKQ